MADWCRRRTGVTGGGGDVSEGMSDGTGDRSVRLRFVIVVVALALFREGTGVATGGGELSDASSDGVGLTALCLPFLREGGGEREGRLGVRGSAFVLTCARPRPLEWAL